MPEGERGRVLDSLVDLVYAYQPQGGGPHFSGGTIGMAPIVRALMEGGRDDVLWDALQEDTYRATASSWSRPRRTLAG